ncbi:epoxide hydrolase [Fusarium albosuccineum]|uniref:Epoxide hydrolase n=1 Tax=Fusarium albosuccineum TaxID=1237068 RepID=A0A8H4LHA7_9HYPO|nr:epoxide hydrolase [Fusarium albosuccineum]
MTLDKLKPDDDRIQHLYTTVRRKQYYYALGTPPSPPKDTILLVHGFPDLGFGWRYQVPFLMNQGYQVIVPDSLGFGKTDAPKEPRHYSFKSVGDDLMELVRQIVPTGKIILGGHDWGGTLVCRMALWHRESVKAVFAIGIPYTPFSTEYLEPEVIVASGWQPYLGYQVQFRGSEVERKIQGRDGLSLFFSAMFCGTDPYGELGFSLDRGLLFDRLAALKRPTILDKDEFEFYVNEYNRHGMHGALNWYRNKVFNFMEEKSLADSGDFRVEVPTLVIEPTGDGPLDPEAHTGRGGQFSKLTIRQVASTHWALIEAPEEVNSHITEFLEKL